MTFKNYKSLKIGDWNFKKLIRASDGLVLFEKYSKPYDAEIAYLETTGQQCIDTGIFPSLDMEFNTKIYTPKVRDDYFCSLRKDAGNTRYYLLNYNSSVGYACTKSVWYGAGKKPDYFSTNTHIIKSKITQDKASIEVDGTYVEYADTGGLFSQDKTLPLFGAKLNNSTTINTRSNTGTRCYYAKFISNGQVVGDFIPVRVGNVGYMYDKVTGKLFGNLGAGNFILGPDIVENQYVTDGLISMWDAEWNDGVCSHVSTTRKWNDIVSGYNLKLASGTPNWEAKANVINGKWGIVSPELQALFKAANKNNLSYELCFSALPNINATVLGFNMVTNGIITNANTIGDWCWSGNWIPSNKFKTTRKGTLSVVRNGQTGRTDVYADGETFGGKTGSSGDPTGRTFGIGYGYGQWNNAPTNIKIHCIRLYNRMLTADEIQKNKDIDINRFAL